MMGSLTRRDDDDDDKEDQGDDSILSFYDKLDMCLQKYRRRKGGGCGVVDGEMKW